MNKNRKLINAFLVSTMVLSGLAPVVSAQETEVVERLGGKDRIETSVKVSNEAYTEGTKNVVIAGFRGEVDALTGTMLASHLDAPLLLATDYDSIKDELTRLGAENVYLLGSNEVISAAFESDLEDAELNVVRVEGNDRYETSVAVATRVAKKHNHVFLTNDGVAGGSLADALAAGPVSGRDTKPVLLSRSTYLPEATRAALTEFGVEKVTIVGGPSAVSNEVKEQLEDMGIEVDRVNGKDRWTTAVAVAEKFFVEGNTGKVVIANDGTSGSYADALMGGYLGAKNNAPVLLTPAGSLNSDTKNYLGSNASFAYVLGSGSVVSEDAVTSIKKEINEHIAEEALVEAAKAAVLKYQEAPLKTIEEVEAAEALEEPARTAVAAIVDKTVAAELAKQIDAHEAVVAKAREELEAEELLVVESVSAINATTIEVTFEGVEEPVEFTVDEMTHGENEVIFTYEDQEFTVTVNYVDEDVVALEEAIEAAEEAIAALPSIEDVEIADKDAVAEAKALVAAVKELDEDAVVEGEEKIATLEEAIAGLEANEALAAATEAVEKAEETRTQEDVDAARELVDELIDSDAKDELEAKLDVVQAELDLAEAVAAAEKAVEDLELATSSLRKLETEEDILAAVKLSEAAEAATEAILALDDSYDIEELVLLRNEANETITEALKVLDATEAVKKAEESLLEADLAAAEKAVEGLEKSEQKTLLGARNGVTATMIKNIITKINNNLDKNDVVLYKALNVKPLTDVKAENVEAYKDGIKKITAEDRTLAGIQEVIDAKNKAAVDGEVTELVGAAVEAVEEVELVKYTDFDAKDSDLNDQEAFDKLVTTAQKAIDAVPADYKADEEDEKTVVETLQERLDEAVRLQADFQEKVLPVVKAKGDIALYNALKDNFARVNPELVSVKVDGTETGYTENRENLETVEDVQYLVDTVNATAAVDALLEEEDAKLAEDVTQDDIDAAEELVNFIENRGEEDKDGAKTPDETKQGLLDRVKIANELPLKTINGLETTTNSVHDNIDTLKRYADILGLDLTEFDKLTPNRGVAAINDLIQNKPEKGYTAETLKPTFDEIVATRLVVEESVELFLTGSEEEPLKDIKFITMLADRFEVVNYDKFSDVAIKGEEGYLAYLQDKVERFNALEGEEVKLDTVDEAIDAQKAVLASLDYKNEDIGLSSKRQLLDFAAKLEEIEDKLAEQTAPTGFEIVEDEVEITAGEDATFTIHAVKGEDGDKVAPFEKFNRTYKDVKVELNNGEANTFFYRDIEFVNGVAKVSVPVTKTDVNKITIAADAFKVPVEGDGDLIVPGNIDLTVSVEVSPAELDEVKSAFDASDNKKITFTAKDKFENEIKMFKKGNVRVQLPAGVKSETPKSDATGLVLVNVDDKDGTATVEITLSAALEPGKHKFTVGGEEVVIEVKAPEKDKE